MTDLTPEEREILEKLKRDDAARDAVPESEKVPVGQPDKYSAPIGLDDEGNPQPDRDAAKPDLAAVLETATRRIHEGFEAAADRLRDLGEQIERAGAARKAEPGGAAPQGEAPDDALSQLLRAMAAKAPDAGPMAPVVGAARQLEQTLTHLGRVIAAASSDAGRQAIAEEVRHVRDTIRSGEGAEPTQAQREAVHEGLTKLWHTLTELGEGPAATPEPHAEPAILVDEPRGEHQAAPDAATADRAAADAAELAGLLNALETGALPAEEVERRLARLRERGTKG